jgi:uncharacterized integral membrane protein
MGRMKADFYTKFVLTVIAVCLLGLVFRNAPSVTTAYAESPTEAPLRHVIIDGVKGGSLAVSNSVSQGLMVPLWTTTNAPPGNPPDNPWSK